MKKIVLLIPILIIALVIIVPIATNTESDNTITETPTEEAQHYTEFMPARISVPYTAKMNETIAEIEKQVLYYTNVERKANNLQPLIENATLTRVAREHSDNMNTYAYTDHVDTAGRNPTDRIKETDFHTIKEYGDISYDGIGENLCTLGYGRISGWGDVDKYDADKLAVIMVLSLMDSEKHRENILNPVYTHVGIGVSYGYGNYYLTQDFW